MEKLLFIIGKIFSYIYPSKLNKLKGIKNVIYTGYQSRRFKKFGKKSMICCSASNLGGLEYIEIGDNVYIGESVDLCAHSSFLGIKYTPKIVFGDYSKIGTNSRLTAINGIIIGKYVRMGNFVLISDNAHGASSYELLSLPVNKRPLSCKGPVVIDNNVWIGDKVSIMSGVHIGFGSIIAANSVVTKDIPPYCVAAGCPAKVVKNMKENS